MDEIGRKLQDAREQLGLSLEEIERSTRIRTHHLQALERGDMDSLPSSVQARGFLSNYADFLGLDVDDILLKYAEGLQSRRPRSRPAEILSTTKSNNSVQVRSRRPRWLSSDLFVAAVIILAVLAVVVWGGSRVVALIQQQPNATEVALEFLIPTSTATGTATVQAGEIESGIPLADPAQETAIPTQPINLGPSTSVQLQIIAESRSWLQVVVDGREEFNGRMAPGEELRFSGDRSIEITTGNAAGLRIFFNGQDQGVLGEVGEVAILLWTLDGFITPTPTETPVPTLTPPASATPLPTSTLPTDAVEG
jgi:cytoskeletal protein RodZ